MHGNGNCNMGDDSVIFEGDKLFQLCEVFGENKELNDHETVL